MKIDAKLKLLLWVNLLASLQWFSEIRFWCCIEQWNNFDFFAGCRAWGQCQLDASHPSTCLQRETHGQTNRASQLLKPISLIYPGSILPVFKLGLVNFHLTIGNYVLVAKYLRWVLISPFLKAESEPQLWVSSLGADSSSSSSTTQLFDCSSSRELIGAANK